MIMLCRSLTPRPYGSGIQEMEVEIAPVTITHNDPLGEFTFPVTSDLRRTDPAFLCLRTFTATCLTDPKNWGINDPQEQPSTCKDGICCTSTAALWSPRWADSDLQSALDHRKPQPRTVTAAFYCSTSFPVSVPHSYTGAFFTSRINHSNSNPRFRFCF